jgi:hypothetical protein
LDLRLKGNRFSENLFNKVTLNLQGNREKASNYTKESYAKLKREVEQVSLVSDTAKSGTFTLKKIITSSNYES